MGRSGDVAGVHSSSEDGHARRRDWSELEQSERLWAGRWQVPCWGGKKVRDSSCEGARAGGRMEVGEAAYSWVVDCAREESSLMAHLEWP